VSATRVYELAKELGLQPADLVATLHDLGVEVASHSSSIDQSTVDTVRELLAKEPDGGGKVVEVPQQVVVRDLAELLSVDPAEVQKALIGLGVLASLTQTISFEQARKVGEQLGQTVKLGTGKPAAKPRPRPKPQQRGTWERPPVVTVLGHVDHGKTSLLDCIRNTSVTEGEYGGITQHIGAYQVMRADKLITFIDTPGHAAFTAMRARGAQVTDIAVLVVAADDGFMPQTREAIDHARAAEVPIIVALNKIDKADANPERVKQQLAEAELVPEEWGGDTMVIPVSATERTGIEDLLDAIQLQAEMMELTGDPAAEATGVVVEARLERGRGPVATLLVQNGTLKVGSVVVVGSTWGKIKAMVDDKGARVTKAGPAAPVEIIGLADVPNAGDQMSVVADERTARHAAAAKQDKEREDRLAASAKVSLEDLYRKLKEGEAKELCVVLRCDVDGSAEAITQSLADLATDEVAVRIIQSSVGAVGEDHILLASASGAIVIAFNSRVEKEAEVAAERERVEVRKYNIIYELLDDVRKAMAGLLEPEEREEIQGHAQVRALFKTPKGVIAGSYVQDGKIVRGSLARLMREGKEIFSGRIESLRHFKDDVREMAAGFECGIQLEGYNDIKEEDIIESYVIEQVARTL
jgi:translation initiation factor IF-2